jgi:hypothetical protein
MEDESARIPRSFRSVPLSGCGGQTDRLSVLQVSLDGRDDDSRFNGEDLDADQGNPHPGVDDHTLVEDPINDFNQAGRTNRFFYGHVIHPLDLKFRFVDRGAVNLFFVATFSLIAISVPMNHLKNTALVTRLENRNCVQTAEKGRGLLIEKEREEDNSVPF